ncbi:MAG: DNA repair protein RadC [Theionarchaea archaeon]|nr:DNA repair protein RadC [Theionarchaea archaeon]
MIMPMKDLPEPERSRKRLAELGPQNLSIQDLLTVLISAEKRKDNEVSEIVRTLVKTFNNDISEICTASIADLSRVEGIQFVKACQIQAAFELGYRIASLCRGKHSFITSTEDVVSHTHDMIILEQEEFRVILLDSKGRVIRCQTIPFCSSDSAPIHPRDVFRPAIAHAASSIIVVHNHPSGDPTPSEQDILLTSELCMCGLVLGIEVVDHVIVGSFGYVSLKHRKLM